MARDPQPKIWWVSSAKVFDGIALGRFEKVFDKRIFFQDSAQMAWPAT